MIGQMKLNFNLIIKAVDEFFKVYDKFKDK